MNEASVTDTIFDPLAPYLFPILTYLVINLFPQFMQRLRDKRAGVRERERLRELRAGRGGLPHGQPHQPQVSSLETRSVTSVSNFLG